MLGLTEQPRGLPAEHRTMHAEAEHLLARAGWHAQDRVLFRELDGNEPFRLTPPDEGCVNAVVTMVGPTIFGPEGFQTHAGGLRMNTVRLCAESSEFVNAGALPGTLALRYFGEQPGARVPAAITAQISGATVVSPPEDLPRPVNSAP